MSINHGKEMWPRRNHKGVEEEERLCRTTYLETKRAHGYEEPDCKCWKKQNKTKQNPGTQLDVCPLKLARKEDAYESRKSPVQL